jgi:hypothetical protein
VVGGATRAEAGCGSRGGGGRGGVRLVSQTCGSRGRGGLRAGAVYTKRLIVSRDQPLEIKYD